MKRELFALGVVFVLLVAFPAGLFGYQAWRTRVAGVKVIDLVARTPEQGGFSPDRLTLNAGERVRLRITSTDVVHGLTIPNLGVEVDEIYPGKVVEIDVTPAQPGRYAFACTRWCGADHWRMRGVIEVGPHPNPPGPPSPLLSSASLGEGKGGEGEEVRPLYQQLGIDLDAMRPDARVTPVCTPSASAGGEASHFAALGVALPGGLADVARRRGLSPADAFHELRADPAAAALNPLSGTFRDDEVWNLVAWAWLKDVDPGMLARAEKLYTRDCAACHGPEGRGDGPAGRNLPGMAKMDPNIRSGPADFTDAGQMLSASDALLQGKLLRGGMGTGMPEFGSLYTDEELWAMITYLRTFLFKP